MYNYFGSYENNVFLKENNVDMQQFSGILFPPLFMFFVSFNLIFDCYLILIPCSSNNQIVLHCSAHQLAGKAKGNLFSVYGVD